METLRSSAVPVLDILYTGMCWCCAHICDTPNYRTKAPFCANLSMHTTTVKIRWHTFDYRTLPWS